MGLSSLLLSTRVKLLILTMSTCVLTACSIVQPDPIGTEELRQKAEDAIRQAQINVEPIGEQLTLDEALARALKYNLDRRSRMMEEAIAFRQLDVSQFDMLPTLLAQAGYNWRSNQLINRSVNIETGEVSPGQFTSQSREFTLSSLGLNWSLIDLGLGYYGAKQQANRLLIATERRRKAMHLLMQDVRTAYWRAVSAQILRSRVDSSIKLAESALRDSRQVESERVRNPVDALRYQRQVLENLRLLEAIEQELSLAHIELAALINAPIGSSFNLVEPSSKLDRSPLEIPIGRLEESAMIANPDLREQLYNVRIARDETRRTLIRLFPNIRLNYGYNYNDDQFLVDNGWTSSLVQVSFNIFNIFTGPQQMKLADAGVDLADHRRVATQMAVVAQVHLARQQLISSMQQFDRSDAIWSTDSRIERHSRNREDAQAQSKLDRVADQTTAILSQLRRYQALAQAQEAEARLMVTVGADPFIGSVGEQTLAELTASLGQTRNVWDVLSQPKPLFAEQIAPVPTKRAAQALEAEARAETIKSSTLATEAALPLSATPARTNELVPQVEQKSGKIAVSLTFDPA
jgi:outer membrane protein TolC